ncbi:MAG: PAS domain-containing protein [Acidobacteriota bacterium]
MARRKRISAIPVARAVESLREGFVLTDTLLDEPGPRILHANAAFLRMTGYSLDEVLGRSPRFLQGPETDRQVLQRLRANLEAGESFHGQTINYRKGGEPFMMRWYVDPVHNQQGRLIYYLAVQRDVSDEFGPNPSQSTLRGVADQLAEGVLIFSPRGEVRYANDAYLRWSGLSYDQILQRPVWRLPGAPEHLEDWSWARRRLTSGKEWKRDYTVRGRSRPELRRFVYANVFPIRSPEGEVLEFLAMVRDVTELHRLRSIAEAQNFHDNLGMVFSGVRHEMGNPVNSVKTALQVVQDNLDSMPREKVRTYLQRMGQEMERLEYMLRSLRSYSLYDRPRIEPVDVGDFLTNFQLLARSALEEQQARFELEVEPTEKSALVDPRALHQVLLNLVANSAKALRSRPGALVTLSAYPSGSHFVLVVKDNGPGIPEEILAHIFKPYYTTRSDGTGLGLAICRHLLSLMGASITLESSGKGTEATILLDLAKP